MAARYAHSEGYTDYLWTKLPMGLTQLVINGIWTISGGKYDLTQFFERYAFTEVYLNSEIIAEFIHLHNNDIILDVEIVNLMKILYKI